MDNVEVPRGRTTSILLLALLTFGTIVFMKVPFLSQHSKYHISFLIVYVWETILFVLALVAMVLIIMLRKHNEHLMVTQGNISRKQHATRCLIFVLFGISASILPFYEGKQVSTCFDREDRTFHVLQFASYLCIGIFTIFQSMFVLLCHKYRCRSFVTRLLVVIILSANVSLLANCVLNTIRSLNTQQSRDPLIHHSSDKNASLYGAFVNKSAGSYFSHTLVYSVCDNGTETIDHSATTHQVHKYTYPLMAEFVLFSLALLVPLWNMVIGRQTNPANINTDELTISDEPTEHLQEHNETQTLMSSASVYTRQGRMMNSLKGTSRFISRRSIFFSSVFAATVLVLHVFVEIGNDIHDNSGNDVTNNTLTIYVVEYYYLQTVYTYIISVVPFIGYFINRQQQNQSMLRFDVDTALLILSGCGHVLLVVFETVDSITVLINHPSTSHLTEDVMYFIKILFHYLGIYFQIKVIIKASCLHLGQGDLLDQKVHAKGIIIFLGICNAERWLADSFMPPTVLRYANDIQGDDTFGHVNWYVIVQDLFPIVMFYRIWSSIMCFKAFDILTRSTIVQD